MTDSFEILCESIRQSLSRKGKIVLALDGFCASGKTTMAYRLASAFDGDVVSMDDFFLLPELRTPKRLSEPGGNVHYERFSEQIIQPLLAARQNESACWPVLSWDKFECCSLCYAPEKQHTQGSPLLIIEGAYSMRPEFRAAYDSTVFLSVSPEVQKQRILARNGTEKWPDFRNKWIPLENAYFTCYDIPNQCRLQLET